MVWLCWTKAKPTKAKTNCNGYNGKSKEKRKTTQKMEGWGKKKNKLGIISRQAMVRDHWDWTKTVSETKVHNQVSCFRRGRMMAYGTAEVQLHAFLALALDKVVVSFAPQPCPTFSLDALRNRLLASTGNWTMIHHSLSLQPSHYNDWATPAPTKHMVHSLCNYATPSLSQPIMSVRSGLAVVGASHASGPPSLPSEFCRRLTVKKTENITHTKYVQK